MQFGRAVKERRVPSLVKARKGTRSQKGFLQGHSSRLDECNRLLTSVIDDLKFVILDDSHSEPWGQAYPSREEALAELERRATIPWNVEPNRAPCTNWAKCGRRYLIEEYDDTGSDQISRVLTLEISAQGVVWRQ